MSKKLPYKTFAYRNRAILSCVLSSVQFGCEPKILYELGCEPKILYE